MVGVVAGSTVGVPETYRFTTCPGATTIGVGVRYPAVIRIGAWARKGVRPRPIRQRKGQNWRSFFIDDFPLLTLVPPRSETNGKYVDGRLDGNSFSWVGQSKYAVRALALHSAAYFDSFD